MLDNSVRAPFNELASLKLEEERVRAQKKFLVKSEEMNSRGILQSSIALSAYNEIRLEGIVRWIPWLWQTLKRVMESKGLRYYQGLDEDLKHALEAHVPISLWEIPAVHLKNPEFLKQMDDALVRARHRALREVKLEIELYASSLKNQSEQATPISIQRELDQKFKILFSPEQATKDFTGWQTVLGQTSRPIAVMFVDIDKFKALNERLMHTTVDETILPEAQRLIAALVLERGGAYKYGGDEYVLILPNHDLSEATRFAEKVRATFEGYQFKVDETAESITVSIGVSLFPSDGDTYKTVLEAANRALLEAKKTKNIVILACELAAGNGAKQKLYHPKTKRPLSPHAEGLARLLSERSINGRGGDPWLEHKEVKRALSIGDEELEEAADELEKVGWAKVVTTINTPRGKFTSIQPTSDLFVSTDAALTNWNPKVDAKNIAKTLVDSDEEGLSVSSLDEHLKWGPRRLNPGVKYLVDRGAVKQWGEGPEPYEFRYLYTTPSTRRFLKDET